MSLVVRARAPLRLSFGGGGTDVSPYPEERGGVVLSTTIDKFAYATIQPRRDTKFEIHSIDLIARRAIRTSGACRSTATST
jgi:D-glycero-alpha-D-manno-heptose-7-phosphate kinase